MRIISIFTVLLIAFTLVSCDRNSTNGVDTPFQDLVISDSFDFANSQDVSIELKVLNNGTAPLKGIYFEVYNADPRSGGDLVAKGITGNDGIFQTVKALPNHVKSVFVVGFFETLELPVVGGQIQHTYGSTGAKAAGPFSRGTSKDFQYLSWLTYNASGTPAPMTYDPLSAAFVTRINQLLPEYQALPGRYPQFFTPGTKTLLKVDQEADISITFVNEGAGWKNTVGFYVYPQGTVVNTVADLGPLYIVYPNASKTGAGGELNAGDQVYIGRIPGGMMVGWFLIANGWVSGSQINSTRRTVYSNSNLNTEVDTSLRQHVIQAYDWETHNIVLAFEDQDREGSTDNDFNDVIFSVKATPYTAIDIADLPPIDPQNDRDGDGVPDAYDDYPDDPELAFDNYTPSENTWGTLGYEDLWPNAGDYDFNDIVMDYNINQITNAQNEVVIIKNKFKLVASGARNKNGFAVQFPVSPANIRTYSGNHPEWLNYEADEAQAIFRFFDNAFSVLPEQPGSGFINTTPGNAYLTPVTMTLDIRLNTPVEPSTFAHQAPFNPFTFSTLERGKEVHLPGYAPTGKVNPAYFGTMHDGSNPLTGHYYYTKTNLPYAVHVPSTWNYPIERSQISRGYLMFKSWAQSNGNSYPDWYLSLPGYTDSQYIYQRP